MVLLRFEDDGEISGVRRKNLERRVMDMSNEKMLARQRSPRNPLLADVMKDFNIKSTPGGWDLERKSSPS